jgi:dihydrofolate reductase
MEITAILARGGNNVIGVNNQLPWYLPADLTFFKQKTLGRHIIMGRKCFESIVKPLPKRVNIVVTRDMFYIANGVLIAHSIEEALFLAAEAGETEAMILGGAEIYRQAMPFCNRLLITDVNTSPEGDVYFTEPEWSEWEEVWSEAHLADDRNLFDYTFREFKRIRGLELPDFSLFEPY